MEIYTMPLPYPLNHNHYSMDFLHLGILEEYNKYIMKDLPVKLCIKPPMNL